MSTAFQGEPAERDDHQLGFDDFAESGPQRSLTFENLPSAERFKTLLEDHGPDEALRVVELDEIVKHVPTVTEWLNTHIDNLTGVQPATLARYRTYVRRDVDPMFGSLPISAVTETTIARWIKQLGGSGKTISNKHGFVSGAFNAAVRAGVMSSNPCVGRRLPHTRVEETVFLTPEEFRLLRDHSERERWKNLATWLVTTGMRFSEATALSAADIDVEARRAESTRHGSTPATAGPRSDLQRRRSRFAPSACRPPRSRSSISLRRDPSSPTARGIPFAHRSSSAGDGLTKEPRVHDLRHTCASWMIQAGVPLPLIQQHLGHESIQTTIGVYGHLDRRSAQAAADAIGSALG